MFKAKVCGDLYEIALFDQGAPCTSSALITKDGAKEAAAFKNPRVILTQWQSGNHLKVAISPLLPPPVT